MLKFGILGCAGIAEKFCQSVKDSGTAEVAAVGSRSKEKCTAWVGKNCPGAKIYDTYDAVLDDPEVQAVYLPLPTGIRQQWALKAVAKGKHILTEKPIGTTIEEALEVTKACKKSGLQYMDDTMFMHHDRTAAMRKELDSEDFGTPTLVVSSFSVSFPTEDALSGNIRAQKANEPLGCLGDLGWYSIRFSLWAFNYDNPKDVSCIFHEVTDEGVPLTATATLRFEGKRTATFDCSFKRSLRQWAEVTSNKRVLYVDDFVVNQSMDASYKITTASIGDRALFFPAEKIKEETIKGCSQNAQVVRAFSELVLAGKTDDAWITVAEQTQRVLDACILSGQADGKWVPVSKS